MICAHTHTHTCTLPSTSYTCLASSWRLLHDVKVGRVEAESGGREAIGDEVDPEQLHRDQGLWKTQGSRQEDAGLREEGIRWERSGVGGTSLVPSLYSPASFFSGVETGNETRRHNMQNFKSEVG